MADINRIVLPCGGVGIWDEDSDSGYRCIHCFAVIGSVGMPAECKRLMEEEEKEYG